MLPSTDGRAKGRDRTAAKGADHGEQRLARSSRHRGRLPRHRHGRRRLRGGQRPPGRPLLLHRLRHALRRLPRPGDRLPGRGRLRADVGPGAVRAARPGPGGHRARRARGRARRRRDRPVDRRPVRGGGLRLRGRPRGPAHRRPAHGRGRARQGGARRDRRLRGHHPHAGGAVQLLGPVPARLRAGGPAGGTGRPSPSSPRSTTASATWNSATWTSGSATTAASWASPT